MIRALTRFVDVPWYAATLDLVNGTYNFKGNVTKIEQIRANGTGFDNYTGAAFPSLTSLVAGKFYRFDLKNLGSGVDIDNGTPPTGASPDTLDIPVPEGSDQTPAEEDAILQTQGLTYSSGVFTNVATGAAEAGTVSFRLDGGSLLTYAQFNAAVSNVPVGEIKAGSHTYTVVSVVASGAECILTLTS